MEIMPKAVHSFYVLIIVFNKLINMNDNQNKRACENESQPGKKK